MQQSILVANGVILSIGLLFHDGFKLLKTLLLTPVQELGCDRIASGPAIPGAGLHSDPGRTARTMEKL
ncbi:MAG: hypothetical protein ABSG96_21605 [Terracidiphilus sp.]|jgi:hypothetical protein